MRSLVIVGAGTAGTMVANRLRPKLGNDWTITLVDPATVHYYQPGFLFLPFGIYSRSKVVRALRPLRMPDHQVQPGAVGQRGGQRRQRLLAGGHEGRAQQQVLGRIAAQRQLGRDHQPRAFGMGRAGRVVQQAQVALEVADRGVDLRQRDFQHR